jgi:hypothetical protein
MTRYAITIETGNGKTVVKKIAADGINHDPFYVSFLNEQKVQNPGAPQAAAYLVAMIPRERVVLIEREE